MGLQISRAAFLKPPHRRFLVLSSGKLPGAPLRLASQHRIPE